MLARVNGSGHVGAGLPHQATSVQDPWELGQLVDLLNRRRVVSYLEVGVCYGGTFEAVVQSVPSIKRAVAVDFPGGDGGQPDSAEFMIAACQRLRGKDCAIDYVFGPSSAPEVIARVARLAPFDAILIDADHTYAGVKRDFATYAPMGKLIALHDIARVPGTAYLQAIEVQKFWQEIKPCYRVEEFVAPGSKMGIGVVYQDR